jgi:hypothetical protein
MEIFYKCKCMAQEVKLTVPDRHPDADIEAWMHVVTGCIAGDHQAHSPRCQATAMEYAKIPLADKDAPIGMPLVKN